MNAKPLLPEGLAGISHQGREGDTGRFKPAWCTSEKEYQEYRGQNLWTGTDADSGRVGGQARFSVPWLHAGPCLETI